MGRLLKKTFLCPVSISKNTRVPFEDLLIFIIITVLAMYARISLFNFVSHDYKQFLFPWFEQIKTAGGFRAVGLAIGNYTPPYLYLMAGLTYLPFSALTSIKLLSCIFDFCMAIFVMKLVFVGTKSRPAAVISYAAALFLPTVLLNGALWGQCDSIYTAFLVICLYCFVKDRPFAGMIFYSVAFAFKLQAIFLAPFLLLLLLRGKVKLRYFLLIPAVYLLGILPAWIAGRPFLQLLSIYSKQTGQYSRMSLSAPNLYVFLNNDTTGQLSYAAIMLCGVAVLLSLYLLFIKKVELEREVLITAACYFAILVPFLLPHMHERYFYAADVLSVLYAFYRPKRFYLPLLVGTASLAGYLPFLFNNIPIPLELACLFMLAALVITAYDLFYPLIVLKKPENRIASK